MLTRFGNISNYKWQISEKGRNFLFACDYCAATQRNVSLRYASAKNDYLLSRDGRQKTFNAEMKKAELAFKRFIRFLLARAAMTWGVELMAEAFRVYQFYRQGRMGHVIIMKKAAKGGGGMTTDEALYRRYLDGDEDALGELMERYGTKLTLYLDGYLCDLHEAEDLMIEVFAYLIAKRPAIRDGGFRAYLYQSARHMALRLLHKKRARNCFSLDALTEEPEARELVEETVQSAERARLLRTCMAELHEDYREALFLVYFEGLSHAETAAVMDKREKQVADLIYRGKIALRKRLEQEGITDAYNG